MEMVRHPQTRAVLEFPEDYIRHIPRPKHLGFAGMGEGRATHVESRVKEIGNRSIMVQVKENLFSTHHVCICIDSLRWPRGRFSFSPLFFLAFVFCLFGLFGVKRPPESETNNTALGFRVGRSKGRAMAPAR